MPIERRIIGSVMCHIRRQPPAPSTSAASVISFGISFSAAEYTSIENAVPRQTFANDTARIGSVNSQFWDGRWSQSRMAFRVPSRRKKAYSRNARHHLRQHPRRDHDPAPTSVRTGFDARCIRAASARPSVFWPTSAETTVKTSVSQTALQEGLVPERRAEVLEADEATPRPGR